ncbi:unnamed protein product [Sphagnum compactum]
MCFPFLRVRHEQASGGAPLLHALQPGHATGKNLLLQLRPPLWSSSSSNLNSKFSVWKDNPGSIQDRRQRFFQQTGFKNLRGEQQQRFGRGSGGSLSKSMSAPELEIKNSAAERSLAVGKESFPKHMDSDLRFLNQLRKEELHVFDRLREEQLTLAEVEQIYHLCEADLKHMHREAWLDTRYRPPALIRLFRLLDVLQTVQRKHGSMVAFRTHRLKHWNRKLTYWHRDLHEQKEVQSRLLQN